MPSSPLGHHSQSGRRSRPIDASLAAEPGGSIGWQAAVARISHQRTLHFWNKKAAWTSEFLGMNQRTAVQPVSVLCMNHDILVDHGYTTIMPQRNGVHTCSADLVALRSVAAGVALQPYAPGAHGHPVDASAPGIPWRNRWIGIPAFF
jgi:hypothetical protein